MEEMRLLPRVGSCLILVVGCGCRQGLSASTLDGNSIVLPVQATGLKACVEETLSAHGETPSEAPGRRETLLTALKRVTSERLREIARLPGSTERWDQGMHRLQLIITQESARESHLAVRALILAKEVPRARQGPPYPMGAVRPTDWRPVQSNGTLERKWGEIIRARCAP